MRKRDGVFNMAHIPPPEVCHGFQPVNGPQSAPGHAPWGCGEVGRRKVPRQGKCSQMPLSAVSELLQLPALWFPASGGGAASRTGTDGEGSHVGKEGRGGPDARITPAARWWGSSESAQEGLGRGDPNGRAAARVQGASAAGSGHCCKHPPDPSEQAMGWAHSPLICI